nr:hypothetical protein [Tanacetum cinerariifolium]
MHRRPLHLVNIILYTTPSPRHQSTPRPQQHRRLFQPLPPSWWAVGGGLTTTAASWLMSNRCCPPPNHHCGGCRTTVHHYSRTLWCRALMAQPLGVSHYGQLPKTTAVVAAEPVENTTAAPCGVGLVMFQIQQYFQHEHYALWEVIEFDDSYVVPANTTDTTSGDKSGRTVTLTAEDMQMKKNDVKARTTLLLSLPDEHQLRFSKYKTA